MVTRSQNEQRLTSKPGTWTGLRGRIESNFFCDCQAYNDYGEYTGESIMDSTSTCRSIISFEPALACLTRTDADSLFVLCMYMVMVR